MSPDESSFVTAAEKAIEALRNEVQDARKAARKRTMWNIILSIVTVVTLAVASLGVVLFFQLHQQAVISCQAGNDRAAGTVTALNELVLLLEGPHPTVAVQKEAAAYNAYVLAHNSPRNCPQAYHVIP